MDRRRYLMSIAGLATMPWADALLPRLAGAASPACAGTDATPAGAVAGQCADRADRLASTAWQRNFAAVPDAYGPTRVAFDKPLPDGLAGVLYRNGPARFHRGPTHYGHWFDGDGMIQSFSLAGRDLVHQGRMVRTAKFEREERAGRFLYPGFATSVPSPARIDAPDDLNSANISVLPIDGGLLALWEGGSPYRIDPASLATLGRQTWSEETDGMPFSAHPKRELDGTVWSFGYMAGSGKLALYRLDRHNRLTRAAVIEARDVDMVHDFAITRRYLVFVTMPFDYQRERNDQAFYQRFRWNRERASQVLLVDKSTLTLAHRIELPGLAVFHFANAWDDGAQVRVQLMQLDDFGAANDAIMSAMRGEPIARPTHTRAVELRVEPRGGRATSATLHPMAAEFPSIDPRRVGVAHRHVFAATRSEGMPDAVFGFDAIARLDTRRGTRERYVFGASILAEEPLYVPRPGGTEGVGWVLATAYDFAAERTTLHVFDAQAVDAGPLCRAALPYGLPLGLHGAFVPA
ncbi:MAG: carotenoid oxygenase family protein [Burkholderiaceae bacterium]